MISALIDRIANVLKIHTLKSGPQDKKQSAPDRQLVLRQIVDADTLFIIEKNSAEKNVRGS